MNIHFFCCRSHHVWRMNPGNLTPCSLPTSKKFSVYCQLLFFLCYLNKFDLSFAERSVLWSTATKKSLVVLSFWSEDVKESSLLEHLCCWSLQSCAHVRWCVTDLKQLWLLSVDANVSVPVCLWCSEVFMSFTLKVMYCSSWLPCVTQAVWLFFFLYVRTT